MKHFFILFSFITGLTLQLKAQEPVNNASGKITGRIVDSLSGKPVEYTSISLTTQSEGKVVNGTTTDDKGVFKLTNVADGTYKMLMYFVGYKTGTLNNIVVSKTNPVIALGDIKLANKLATLKEVTVTSEKSIIENKIDKLVYNADQDITSQSGVAADILKKVPMVSIDVDGNVELQGNASIRFLINGKPSSIFGSNIADVLQSIPANQIQSIEVITSPGAKYDAEGTAGIINIILKKSTAEGINGNVSLSGGTRLENGSLNLNAHHGHFSANAFASGSGQLQSTTINTMNRSSLDPLTNQSSQLDQNGSSEFTRRGIESGVGFDWEINPKNDITGSIGFDYFGYYNKGTNNRHTVLKDSLGATSSDISDQTATTNNTYGNSLDWQLNYKKTFKKEDQELDISYVSSMGNNYTHYDQSQKYLSPDSVYSGAYGNNPGTDRETNIAIDYVQPIGKNTLIEAGAKTVITQIASVSDVYLLNAPPDQYTYNANQSLSLNYRSNVYAGYLSGTFKLFDWLDVKAGLRYEYTEPHATFSNSGTATIKAYGTYVPSGVISHKFKKGQTIKLSYTHRIERPGYRDLNTFVNASDPKNLTTGNTSLRPEIGDKIELGFSKTFEKGTTINATLFYRGNKDDIQSYSRYYSSYAVGDSVYNNVNVTTRENVGREDNYGLSIFASIPITSKINIRTNINCFQRYIINGALPGNNIQGFNYRINMNFTYQISKTFVVEAFGNFNSPRVNVQGTMPAFTTYNFALRKQFFNKNLSIAITATNVFNKYVNQKTQLTGDNFVLYNERQLPYRSFGINITYKFGRLEFKGEKNIEDTNLTNPQG